MEITEILVALPNIHYEIKESPPDEHRDEHVDVKA